MPPQSKPMANFLNIDDDDDAEEDLPSASFSLTLASCTWIPCLAGTDDQVRAPA